MAMPGQPASNLVGLGWAMAGRERLELIGSGGINASGNNPMTRLNTAIWTARCVAVGATGAWLRAGTMVRAGSPARQRRRSIFLQVNAKVTWINR